METLLRAFGDATRSSAGVNLMRKNLPRPKVQQGFATEARLSPGDAEGKLGSGPILPKSYYGTDEKLVDEGLVRKISLGAAR